MGQQPATFNRFKSIFQEMYPEMVKTALFYLQDEAIAEDIVQEIFAKLWEQGKDLEQISNVRGYLLQAVKNSSLNYLKHQEIKDKYREEYLRLAEEDEGTPEEYLQLVRDLVEQLPPKRKTVLELSVVEAKSYQEIADLLNLSVNTVKDHIKKAYAFLREKAQEEIPGYILYIIFTKK